MPRILALTQLLIVGLGAPLLHLMVRIQNKPPSPDANGDPMAFLARHVLWFFAVPILYVALATGLRGRVGEKVIRFSGVAICGLLFLVFAIPFLFYLR